jgi:hypothetical protein
MEKVVTEKQYFPRPLAIGSSIRKRVADSSG